MRSKGRTEPTTTGHMNTEVCQDIRLHKPRNNPILKLKMIVFNEKKSG